jgi:hypothetical protein
MNTVREQSAIKSWEWGMSTGNYGKVLTVLAIALFLSHDLFADSNKTPVWPFTSLFSVLACAICVHALVFAILSLRDRSNSKNGIASTFLFFIRLPILIAALIPPASWLVVSLLHSPWILLVWIVVMLFAIGFHLEFVSSTNSLLPRPANEVFSMVIAETIGYGLGACIVSAYCAVATVFHGKLSSDGLVVFWYIFPSIALGITFLLPAYDFCIARRLSPDYQFADAWKLLKPILRSNALVAGGAIYLLAMFTVIFHLPHLSTLKFFLFIYVWWYVPLIGWQILRNRQKWNLPLLVAVTIASLALLCLASKFRDSMQPMIMPAILIASLVALILVRFKVPPRSKSLQ